MNWILNMYHHNIGDWSNNQKKEKKYRTYFTKSLLFYALTINFLKI
jgi:hypothetical protein